MSASSEDELEKQCAKETRITVDTHEEAVDHDLHDAVGLGYESGYQLGDVGGIECRLDLGEAPVDYLAQSLPRLVFGHGVVRGRRRDTRAAGDARGLLFEQQRRHDQGDDLRHSAMAIQLHSI